MLTASPSAIELEWADNAYQLLAEAWDHGGPRLRELGWGGPHVPLAIRRWRWPGRSRTRRRGPVELMTRTLRDVYGADPRRLRYRAAYGVSDEDWDASRLGLAERLTG
ncbi:hypothetical protein AFR_12215 [Actinoplanes friuliensis DSM 7358]|uniref:TY-Chap N-terminal domain-containing protein n=1 Tax=Actinoplanes friuliensis DSM 7358 TaxID=1246995 RepID=U5VV35_9ACTN|nr:hypothetical protein [Actinoplanes friuliensis]AGZ40729.1 hypothetical protein AFR_12215 [Actinoplanes friuliensis DSM 7358]